MIAVVGAGIGGLSLAVGLQRVGLPVTVYEAAPSLAPVGAGIGLWPGALHALRELGIADWFWDLPVCPFRWAQTSTPAGRPLVGFELLGMTGGLGYVVRRTDLHAGLLDALSSPIQLGRQLAQVRVQGSAVELGFTDGTRAHADLVVGADGLHSRLRQIVIGDDPPRYSGETVYRGMARFAMADPGLMLETQGGGVRGAVHAIDADHVYWWVAQRGPAGGSGRSRDHVLSILDGWAGELPAAVAATAPEAILRNDIYDRDPVSGWSAGPLCLLGDAAHPTTPNLGLGGCMAIEDGLVLARALRQDCGPSAFQVFEAQRRARTREVVRASRWMGRMGSITHPAVERLWRRMSAATPDRVAAGLLARQVGFDPGLL
jgi:2-polyprenyl-6-methoxyphenol hydroxylase-like FAD-dependent oxidoreductase